jgi:hypothetical protein
MNNKVGHILIFIFLSGCASKPTVRDSEQFSRDMIECAHKNFMFGASFGVYELSEYAANNSAYFIKMATIATSESFVEKESPIIRERVKEEFFKWIEHNDSGRTSFESAWKDYEASCLAKAKPWMDLLIPKKTN